MLVLYSIGLCVFKIGPMVCLSCSVRKEAQVSVCEGALLSDLRVYVYTVLSTPPSVI